MRKLRTHARPGWLLAAAGLTALIAATPALANHGVLVEGNCPGPAARTLVAPGTCGDFDGDGRIGTAEDVDAPDRVFGTINAALGAGTGPAAGTGANQNGRVTIVASGNYPEIVLITGANGNVQLEGAPGVEAVIEAVLQGDATPPGNGGRQDAPGIIVNTPADRHVIIRNITTRNWTSGIRVLGDSRVTLENVVAENNVHYGIEVRDNAKVAITGATVSSTGRRVGGPTPSSPLNDFPRTAQPSPGTGIDYADSSSGTVFHSTVTGSFREGISDSSPGKKDGGVCVALINAFDNGGADLRNVEGPLTSCVDRSGGGKSGDGLAFPVTFPGERGLLAAALTLVLLFALVARQRRGLRAEH